MSTCLNVAPNLDDFDGFYQLLVDTHQDLSEAQSAMLNGQLILLLSNHIGELPLLREAMAIARRNAQAAVPAQAVVA